MAYLSVPNPRRRSAALGAVAALHLIAGYALVTGLAAKFLPPPPPPPFEGTQIPADNIPLPKNPEAKPKQSLTTTETVIDLPPVDSGPIELPPIDFGPIDKGVGEVTFDPPVKPEKPHFAPRLAKPKGGTANWVTANDYPTNELRREHQGDSGLLLTVSPEGRVTRCEIAMPSGWPALDAAACDKVSKRARFEAARDTAGAETEAIYRFTVRWRIPE